MPEDREDQKEEENDTEPRMETEASVHTERIRHWHIKVCIPAAGVRQQQVCTTGK
jgi:hypothetical protein